MLESLEALLTSKASERGIYYSLSISEKNYTHSHKFCELSAHLIRDNRNDPFKIELIRKQGGVLSSNKPIIKVYYNTLFKNLHLSIGDYGDTVYQIQVEGVENLITRILNIYLLKN